MPSPQPIRRTPRYRRRRTKRLSRNHPRPTLISFLEHESMVAQPPGCSGSATIICESD
jgi:hypothetical protein